MAVTFTSNGYDTTVANPYTELAWANAHPVIGASAYGVLGANDWKVTAAAGLDRTVSITPGFGWGCGVTDKTVANETIQLDTITSGSRWDLIVARRDWTPTAGVTLFTKVNGGAAKAIPGGRLSAPGGIDDQPLALVQVTAGQTQPTAIVDLRCWAGNGGVFAKDDLVRTYLTAIGTEINIKGAVWSLRLGANDLPEWARTTDSTTPATSAGWSLTGSLLRTPAAIGTQVSAAIKAIYGGGAFALNTAWVQAFILNTPGYLPVGADAYGYFMLRSGGAGRPVKAECGFTIDPTGAVYIRALLGQAATTCAAGDELSFNTVWNA